MLDIREKLNKISLNLPEYLLLFLSFIIIYGTIVYYFYALNWLAVAVIMLLTISSFFVIRKYLFKNSTIPENKANIKEKNKINLLNYWPYLIYIFFYAIIFYQLFLDRSDRALISPWQVVNSSFFVLYAISSLILVFIIFKNKISSTGKLIILSAHYFLSFSVAAIIYKIGYGFDPFIHQATMELIDKKGLVTPKPLYYLGEYGLIIVLHKLSGLSIYLLNKFLVPVLAAIFLPLASYRLMDQNNSKPSRFLAPLFLLALTFSPFIATTPQNLSYLFLILAVTFGLTKTNPLWPLILSLAALAIHPLTGIPALAWWLSLRLIDKADQIKKNTYQFLKYFLFAASALILPLALFMGGGSSLKTLQWNFHFLIEPLKNLFTPLTGAGGENWLLNFVYFFYYNYALWLILIISASLIWFYQRKQRPRFKSLIFINLALIIAFIISSQIVFTDLISYEQTNFAGRLLVLILIFCLPFISAGLQNFIDLILSQEKPIKIVWLVFGTTLITTSLYVSYPRFDKYFNSRGYSTSKNDLAAVHLIDQEAAAPYIALANQQVSVAALKELGFDHYYDTPGGPLYFYPIPTGGQLYKYYLDMVYKNPSRETMAQARALTGVRESYLVVNKYWFESAKVISAAKLKADSWQTVNNEVYIFKYLP